MTFSPLGNLRSGKKRKTNLLFLDLLHWLYNFLIHQSIHNPASILFSLKPNQTRREDQNGEFRKGIDKNQGKENNLTGGQGKRVDPEQHPDELQRRLPFDFEN